MHPPHDSMSVWVFMHSDLFLRPTTGHDVSPTAQLRSPPSPRLRPLPPLMLVVEHGEPVGMHRSPHRTKLVSQMKKQERGVVAEHVGMELAG
jgi:hypothetical protein